MYILLIEDSDTDQFRYRRYLEKEIPNIDLSTAESIKDANLFLAKRKFDCVLLDYLLPDGTGLDFVQNNHEQLSQDFVPVIVLTSEGDENIAVELMKSGASDYVVKSKMTAKILCKSVTNAIENARLQLDLKKHQDNLGELEHLVNTSTDLIIVVDPATQNIIDCNNSASKLFGMEKAILQKTPIYSLNYHYDSFESFSSLIDEVKSKGSINFETDLFAKNMEKIPFQINISFSETKFGSKLFAVGHELTKTKKIQKLLETEKQHALKMANYKSQFLARMSHDIRTPLNSIVGMTEVLRETPLNNEQKAYLKTIEISSSNLLVLINDILDLSKIEAGELAIVEGPINLENLLIDAISIASVQARRQNTEVYLAEYPNIGHYLLADELRVRQVLMNLLSNAVKFTSNGRIAIFVSVIEEGSFIQISIKDTGIGIPREKIESIFESYKQAESSTTLNYGGTGLGLAICKLLTSLMEGRVWVESEIGKGSTFSFTIPLKRDKDIPQISNRILEGFKIAVLIPNTQEVPYLQSIIENHGGIGVFFVEPNDLKKSLEDNSFDALIFDSKVRKVKLFEFIRSLPVALNRCCLLLPAGGHNKVDASLSEELGLATNFIKPIQRNSFGQELSRVCANQQFLIKPERHNKSEENIDLTGAKILLAEDVLLNQNVIKAYLKNTGCSLTCVTNGRHALEAFKQESFDVIFLDMIMPEMNGQDTTTAIRDWEQENSLPRIPIIALTANGFADGCLKMLDAGCDEFLTKPISRSNFILKIQEYRSSENSVAKSTETSGSAVDVKRMREFREIFSDHDYRGNMFDFLNDAKIQINYLKDSFKNGKIQDINDISYKLCSLSSTYGAKDLSRYCRSLHDLTQDIGNAKDEISVLIADIEKSYLQLKKLLEKEIESIKENVA